MAIQHEDPISGDEAHASGRDFADSVAQLPGQAAEMYEKVGMGEVSMPLDIDGERYDVPPGELELEPDPEDPSRFKAFIRGHTNKKEAVLLGTVTTAVVLAGVAAIRYKRKSK